MALWNSPRAVGDASWSHTAEPPADCPAIVTLRLSPPKREMFCWTQRSAACWSSRPKAPAPCAFLTQLRQVEEAERAEAVVDGDVHRVRRADVLARVGVLAGAAGEAAAVDPDEHRPLAPARVARVPCGT